MTGFGRGVAGLGGRQVTVQLKSVNHRYVDLKIRGAPLEPALEEQVSRLIRQRIERGALALTVRVEGGAGDGGLRADLAAARRAHRELSELARELGLPAGEVTLDLVCAQPGVLVQAESEDEREALAAAVLEAAGGALAGVLEMRAAEGRALAADLNARVDRLLELRDQISQLAATVPDDARSRLQDRLSRLLKDGTVEVDPQRLAQEVALVADRQDVTEELVRIASHAEQFRALMNAKKPVGRRLDFLTQEFGREVNTIGSKAQSAAIAALVVEAKAELEKIREQVQNVE